MSDEHRDPASEYAAALQPEPPAEPDPASEYIKALRAGTSPELQAVQEPAEPARGADGRFTAAEQAEPEEESPLTPQEVTDYFLGGPVDEEEIAERQEQQAQEALRDGTVVREMAERGRIFEEMDADLVARLPGCDSDHFREVAGPMLDQLEADFPGSGVNPTLITQVYNELGGEEEFGPDVVAESWSPEALGINPEKSAFTR